MSKTITLRLEDSEYTLFERSARLDHRAIANFIITKAKAKVEEEFYTDSFETEEILGNVELLKRLKKGSAQAKKRKGKLVA